MMVAVILFIIYSVYILYSYDDKDNPVYLEDAVNKEISTTTTITTTTPKVTTATTTTPMITSTMPTTTTPPETTTTTTTVTTTNTTTNTTTTKPITTTKLTNTTTTYQYTGPGEYILPYELTEDDWFMICKVVSSETGYCSAHQQKAVAYTIFNRIIYSATHTNSPYPKDVYGILHQKNQYNAINYWRNDSRLHPGGSLWNNTMKIIKEAAYEPDFTNGAIGYYNPNMVGYLSAFENNRAIECCYIDESGGRFFRLTQR